jgi:diguanylate cyclase (GGDEF)-like protein
MAHEAVSIDARPYRRPWYWLVVLFAVAGIASALVIVNARSRSQQNDRQFQANQKLRLQLVEQGVSEYFWDASELASSGAGVLAQPAGDPALSRRLVLSLFEARRDANIYGIGVFYAANGLDPRVRFLSVYDHGSSPLPKGGGSVQLGPCDHNLPNGVDEVACSGTGDEQSPNYTKFYWYQRAMAMPDRVTYVGPFSDAGREFISALKPIEFAGKYLGVVSVDALTVTFRKVMLAPLESGDYVWLQDARTGTQVLGTARLPDEGPLVEQSVPLRANNHARVAIFTDATLLHAQDRRVWFAAFGQLGVVWMFAGLVGFGLTRNWRSHEARLRLEVEQDRLESELDVGRRIEAQLRTAAYTDALTGLPNRAALLEAASAAIAVTSGEPTHALFFIDLDRFNMINDTLGHLAGDELLKMIAARLRESLPLNDTIARLGGDEFVICATVLPEDVGAVADRILRCLREPMLLAGRACYTSASIGVVIIDATYRGPEDLLRDADIAMYAAKGRGRACYAIFDTAMRTKVAADSDLENALRRAIERREFVPYYQPIVRIATRDITSFEALVRWSRPGSGIVAASDFIGYAEARGLVNAIDALMFTTVCNDAALLFGNFPKASVAVNISAGHLTTPDLAQGIDATLRAHAIAPERIKLEITETAIMTNADAARATLDELRRNGIQILVDDFGVGHSSLTYLHRLPIAGLKIDRSFVAALTSGDQAVAIVRSIVALAQTLELYTIAEGVETAAQLAVLEELGVVYAQGFFFSPALSLSDLLDFSRESNAHGA